MSNKLLPRLLDGFHENLLSQLELGRKTSDHPALKGDSSEGSWLAMLQTHLPQRYQVSKGIVVDSTGNQSDQIDLIIFDRQYSPFIFKTEAAEYIPAESVYAVFEIKQSLNRENVLYAQEKIKSVRKLKRTSLPVPNIYGTSDPKEPPYIHGGLLCLSSDWNPPFGDSFEKAMKEDNTAGWLNLVCVAQSGVFESDEKIQILDQKSKAVTFFFFRLLSILQQKATVPMIDVMEYAKWL